MEQICIDTGQLASSVRDRFEIFGMRNPRLELLCRCRHETCEAPDLRYNVKSGCLEHPKGRLDPQDGGERAFQGVERAALHHEHGGASDFDFRQGGRCPIISRLVGLSRESGDFVMRWPAKVGNGES